MRKLLTLEHEWSDIAKRNKIDRLPQTGENYHQSIFLSTKHPFWKSVILAYKKWYTCFHAKIPSEAGKEFLWGNPRINIPFNFTLFKANLIYLQDLYNDQGEPLSKVEIENLTGKNIMFTTFLGIWNAIPKIWKDQIRNIKKYQMAFRPQTIEWLTRDKKGTINIRKIWDLDEEPVLPGKTKWINELNLDPTESWKPLFLLPIQSKINVRCKYFQFQIMHRTLITNRKLKQFGIRENELCDECNEVETISHLLYECNRATEIWQTLRIWLESISPNTMYFDKKSILLGNNKNEIIINYIIMITKHELYKSKWNKVKINLIKLKHIFKVQMDLEIYSGTVRKTLPKVLGKWSSVLNHLRNL